MSELFEVDIERLRGHYHISRQYRLMASDEDGWVVRPPNSYIAVYEEFLRLGLQFSIHPFFVNILDFYEVVPAQLTLNSIRILSSFVVLCHLLYSEPQIFLFLCSFRAEETSSRMKMVVLQSSV